jgi:S-adenosylmethionine hydrolase
VVIQVDRFGNATTQMAADHVPKGATFAVNAKRIGRLRRTYGDVPSGTPLALIGSSGLLEIAVRDGSAATELEVGIGSVVEILVNS